MRHRTWRIPKSSVLECRTTFPVYEAINRVLCAVLIFIVDDIYFVGVFLLLRLAKV